MEPKGSLLYSQVPTTWLYHELFFFTYSLFILAFGWCILCIVNTFLVFLSVFLISSNLQLIIPKLYLNTGTANVPVVVILFLAFNLDVKMILNLLVCSFFNFSYICSCCMPSLFSICRYLYVFPCSSSCISLLKSSIQFYEWTNFPLISTTFAHLSFQIPYGYHHWRFWLLASVSGVLPVFYLSASIHPCKVNVIPLFLLCVLHILYSSCLAALWRGLSWLKIAVATVILLVIFHIVFLNLLLLLSSSPYVDAYLFSSN